MDLRGMNRADVVRKARCGTLTTTPEHVAIVHGEGVAQEAKLGRLARLHRMREADALVRKYGKPSDPFFYGFNESTTAQRVMACA